MLSLHHGVLLKLRMMDGGSRCDSKIGNHSKYDFIFGRQNTRHRKEA
jgi:hypothetical protein